MKTGRLEVAIVGAGLMGRFHAAAAKRSGAVVTAIADEDFAKAQTLARAVGKTAVPMRLADLLAKTNCDAVHICTPAGQHAESARSFLSRGVHVLSEKPVAETAAETQQLLEIAEAKNRILCAVHQFPFQNGVARVLEHQDLIGPIRHLTGELCTAGDKDGSDASRDHLAMSVLPHPLSLFRAFGVRRLAGTKWRVTCAAAGELSFTGAHSGIGMSFLISTRGRPTRNSFKVIGERGTGSLDLFHGFSVLERGSVSRMRKISQPFTHSAFTIGHASLNGARRALRRESAFPGLRELVKGFYKAISDGAASPVSSEEILDIARARDAISVLCRSS